MATRTLSDVLVDAGFLKPLVQSLQMMMMMMMTVLMMMMMTIMMMMMMMTENTVF